MAKVARPRQRRQRPFEGPTTSVAKAAKIFRRPTTLLLDNRSHPPRRRDGASLQARTMISMAYGVPSTRGKGPRIDSRSRVVGACQTGARARCQGRHCAGPQGDGSTGPPFSWVYFPSDSNFDFSTSLGVGNERLRLSKRQSQWQPLA